MVKILGFKISILVVCSLVLQACVDMDILMTPDSNDYLKGADGFTLSNCEGGSLSKKNNAKNEAFWKKHNLPKGTINFICVDGKAYLSGQEPKAK